jgi:hypothetical protein
MEQAFAKLGTQMVESAFTNLLQLETVQGRKRLGDARTAAADAYEWAGNPILGAVLGAAAFASVMAFEQGGEIPGTGALPIIAHGGETVVTKALTDQVRGNVGGGGRGHTISINHNISTVDSEGFSRLLEKNANAIQRHVRGELRKAHKKG